MADWKEGLDRCAYTQADHDTIRAHIEGLVKEQSRLIADIEAYQRHLSAEAEARIDAENRYDRMLAKYERMEQRFADYREDRESEIETIKFERKRAEDEAEAAKRDARAKQARIDALMLEYCPEDMTPEQVAEWKGAIATTEQADED